MRWFKNIWKRYREEHSVMNLTVGDVLSLTHGALRNTEGLNPKIGIRVSTDSRTVQRGDVFFAIRGEKFDGHEFVTQAFERGAIAAVVEGQSLARSGIASFGVRPLVVVKDATKALGQLAQVHRNKFSIPCIAIAGSNGKTTTKDMVASVLSTKYSVLKTEGNLNNHIGVPLTLFRLQKKHSIAVLELGTNHFGELPYLCDIVQPTHGLVTNIGREHLEFFRNLQGVAKEEGGLFDALAKSGTGFVNVDDPFLVRRAKKLRRKITYGFTRKPVHVRAAMLGLDAKARASFSVTIKGKTPFSVRLAVPGKHIGSSALAAVAVGSAFTVPIARIRQSLARFTSSGKRMEVLSISGVTILNDTYNANPDSTVAALETLKAMRTPGKKIAVLADMLELGAQAQREHTSIGTFTRECADYLLTYGQNARLIHEASALTTKFHYDQKNVLSEYLAELVSPGDIVLVKGSRALGMEDVVTFLSERLRTTGNVVSIAG